MATITKESYVNRMLPVLLATQAKEKGIIQSDTVRMHALTKKIKRELSTRFDSFPLREIFEELSRAQKDKKKKEESEKTPMRPLAMNFTVNDVMVEKLAKIPRKKQAMVKEFRADCLSRANKAETELHQILTDKGVLAYQKFPFIVEDKIHFANIVIPKYKVVIEMLSTKMSKKEIGARIKALAALGYRLEVFPANRVRHKGLIDNLIESFKK